MSLNRQNPLEPGVLNRTPKALWSVPSHQPPKGHCGLKKIPIKSSSLAQRETLPGEVKLQNLQPQLIYVHFHSILHFFFKPGADPEDTHCK